MRIGTGADFHPSAQRDIGRLSFLTALPDEVPEFQRIQAVTVGIDLAHPLPECGIVLMLCYRGLGQVVIQLQVYPALRHWRVASCAGNHVEVQAGIRQPILVCQARSFMAVEAS